MIKMDLNAIIKRCDHKRTNQYIETIMNKEIISRTKYEYSSNYMIPLWEDHAIMWKSTYHAQIK